MGLDVGKKERIKMFILDLKKIIEAEEFIEKIRPGGSKDCRYVEMYHYARLQQTNRYLRRKVRQYEKMLGVI